ncbi:putative golgin subfamily A member 6-like protein 3 [Arachis ipaensis]|uniref:putative golgin subfamily A member 6-like protein 3 n=1 Tax=Arachis ipaensis TaxID=130454 RepID=UPI0007AFD756|nr:putative golgin subfamily A member 6-like protein 3 [Arachis ipaensis]
MGLSASSSKEPVTIEEKNHERLKEKEEPQTSKKGKQAIEEQSQASKKEEKPYTLAILYPQRFNRELKDQQFPKFLEVFKKLEINIPLAEFLEQMPLYAKFLKELINKKKTIDKALYDLGSSINLMPLSMMRRLSIEEVKPTQMSLELVDRYLPTDKEKSCMKVEEEDIHWKEKPNEEINSSSAKQEIDSGEEKEGKDWERDSEGAPSHLRRINLIPEAKGWYEIVRRSILPTANTSEVTIKRAILTYCILRRGEVNVPQLIADSIQEIAEDTGKSRLGHPSTILRLCKRAGVFFEDENTEKVKGSRGITKQSMEGVTDDTDNQQERRAQGRGRRPQVEGEQAPAAMDLSQLQRAIEEISQQHMRAEQYLRQQEQYMQQQEQYLKDREQQLQWQQEMMEIQENFQLQMLDQQREFQAKVFEGQKEQSANVQESINGLFLRQAKYGEYTQNLYQWKNIYHTIGEHSYVDRMEYDIATQAKLDYVVHSMPALDQQIKPF